MPRISRKARNDSLAKARKQRWTGDSADISSQECTLEMEQPSTSSGTRGGFPPRCGGSPPRSRFGFRYSRSSSTSSSPDRLDIPISERPYNPPSPVHHSQTRFEKKLALVNEDDTDDTHAADSNDGLTKTICELSMLTSFVSLFQCPQPGCTSNVECRVNVSKRKGFAVCLEAFCCNCTCIVASTYTSDVNTSASGHPKPFTINTGVVVACLKSDMGPNKLSNFCETLSMPSLHKKTFTKRAEDIYGLNVEVSEQIFSKAVAVVKKEHQRQLDVTIDNTEPLDVAVSFDGTWMTRGHSSLIGIGCAIDSLTGLVVDAHVVSAFCQTCATTGKWQKANNPHRYDAWLIEHQEEGCNINYTGTSGMMEAVAAETLWKRSVDLHQLRYTTFVGDGDSKAFDRVCRGEPYGPNVTIIKEECMNHVSKRIGTALRNLVQDCSKKGTTLGGRKYGSLTGNAIDKLCKYYARAIRGHDNVDDMKTAIFASVYHGYSTDDNPQHRYSPSGIDSWCFYKKAIAQAVFPGQHKLRIHTPLDYERLHQHVWPVYQRLTDDNLLRRCKLHATQNANESLHHAIWAKCNKTLCHSAPRVTFSLLSAVAEFNFGARFAKDFNSFYGIQPGEDTLRLQQVRHQKRLSRSISTATGKEKSRKDMRKQATKRAEEDAIKDMGDLGYGAGKY